MAPTDVQERRRGFLDQIVNDVWFSAFPLWGLSFLGERIAHWFLENRVSIGLFVSWPKDGGSAAVIGKTVAILSMDSPARLVVVGWSRLNGRDIARLAEQGRRVRIRVLGWFRISPDVDAEVATRVLDSVRVLGVSRIPQGLRLAVAGCR